jgi:DNA repair protein RadA/Sms
VTKIKKREEFMAKLKTVYICSDCGYESSKWLGKCPECGSWGTLEEEVSSASSKSSVKRKVSKAKVVSFKDVEVEKNYRYTTKFNEFDRVLGGGLVKGAVVLLTGNPGIGKSTLLLQAVDEYSQYGEVLRITGAGKIQGRPVGLIWR